MVEFPPFSLAPFITPMATQYDPNGAVANAVHARQVTNQDAQAKAALAENKRQFNAELPLKQFQTFMPQYNANREYDEREQERATKLLDWVKSTVEEDPEKAQAMAPYIKGILDIHGIQMSHPGEAPQAQPGTAPVQPPSEGEQQIANIKALNEAPVPAGPAPGYGGTEEEGLKELGQAQAASAASEAQPAPEPTKETGPLPGEGLQAYFGRALAPQVPKAQAKGAPAAAPAEAAPMPGEEQPTEGGPASAKWEFSYHGKPIGSIDTYRIAEMNARRTHGVGKGFETGAMPEADRAFINGAIDKAMETGAVRTPEQLAGYIKSVIQPELDRRSKERSSFALAASKQAAGGGSQERLSFKDGVEIAQQVGEKQGLSDINKTLGQMPQIREKLNSGQYGAVNSAIYNIARSNDPRGIVTDKDFSNAQTRTLFDKLRDFFTVNDPTADPHLNEDEVRRLGDVVTTIESALKARQQEIMKSVPNVMKRMPNREMVDGALSYFDTQFAGVPGWDPAKWNGAAPPAAAAGGGAPKSSQSVKGSPAAEEMAGKTKSLIEEAPQ